MKKMIIAVVAIVMAVVAQAATFNWKTDTNVMGVDLAAITGNGEFGIGSQTAKAQGSSIWTAVLAIYDGETLVGQQSFTAKFGTTNGKAATNNIAVGDALDNTSYNYVLTLTGAPAGLTGKEDAAWDYSAATLSTTIKGTITTASMGNTTLTTATPTAWTVAGAVETIPEPTSGLLMLLGMAGLALRRRRA